MIRTRLILNPEGRETWETAAFTAAQSDAAAPRECLVPFFFSVHTSTCLGKWCRLHG